MVFFFQVVWSTAFLNTKLEYEISILSHEYIWNKFSNNNYLVWHISSLSIEEDGISGEEERVGGGGGKGKWVFFKLFLFDCLQENHCPEKENPSVQKQVVDDFGFWKKQTVHCNRYAIV